MSTKNNLANYALNNAQSAAQEVIYVDAAGGAYASELGQDFADTANAILFLVDEFVYKRGLFDVHSNEGTYSQKDLNGAISQLIVELHNITL